jgi:hypothetical protein
VERGGREGEGGYCAGKEIEGKGARIGGGGAWARAMAGLGRRRGLGRLLSTRSRLLLIDINPRIENQN